MVEEKLLNRFVPAAPLGRHALNDLAPHQQLPVFCRPVVAALISVDQQMVGFDLPVRQGTFRASITNLTFMVEPILSRPRGVCTD